MLTDHLSAGIFYKHNSLTDTENSDQSLHY